jgi:hypothetical protein
LRLSKRNVDSTTVAGDALNFGKKLSKDNRFFAYGTAIEHYEEEAKALRNKKNKS